MQTSQTAVLSNQGKYTCYSYGSHNIRFRTSEKLRRYTDVKEWDRGYLVVTADYEKLGKVEEYIDLIPILKKLLIDTESFLEPIKGVVIQNA